ncbi:MAG TPA: serine/threonine-protein kinase [Kofleriaceae bacterium]|nr:serine/threonine-protein kinase [Kofleriaceae bacterium]
MDGCPTENELEAHLAGKLAAAASDSVRTHIDTCVMCQQTLRASLGADDDAADSTTQPPLLVTFKLAEDTHPVPNFSAIFAVGRYDIQHLLGTGGMGAVYAAYDTVLQRDVALKLVSPNLVQNTEFANNLIRESQVLARCNAPSVLTVFDAGRHGDEVFIAMERVDGTTLREWLAAQKRSQRDILQMFCRAAQGLAVAHHANIVHRDFKPENVLVSNALGADGLPARVVVSDFGIAYSPARSMATRSTSPHAVGTLRFMPPEQLRGDAVDARADIFAFGVALWSAIHVRAPFEASETAARLAAIAKGPDLAVTAKPRALDALLRRMLAEQPAQRPATIDEVIVTLQRVLARRRYVAFAAAGLAVAASATVATIMLVGSEAQLASCELQRAYDTAQLRTPALASAVAAACRAPNRRTTDCLRERIVEQAALRTLAAANIVPAVGQTWLASVVPIESCALPTFELAAQWPAAPAAVAVVAQLRNQLALLPATVASDGIKSPALHQELHALAFYSGWRPAVLEVERWFANDLTVAPLQRLATLQRLADEAEELHQGPLAVEFRLAASRTALKALGLASIASENLVKAEAMIERAPVPANTALRLRVSVAAVQQGQGEFAAAEASFAAAAKLAAANHDDTWAESYEGAYYLQSVDKYDEDLTIARAALARLQASGTTGSLLEIDVRVRCAIDLAKLGESAEALSHAAQAATLADRLGLPEYQASTHANYALVLHETGKQEQSLTEIRVAQRYLNAIGLHHSSMMARYKMVESVVLAPLDQADAAIATAQQACEILAVVDGATATDTLNCWNGLAANLASAGQFEQALKRLDALRSITSTKSNDILVINLNALRGHTLLGLHRYKEAIEAFAEAETAFQASGNYPRLQGLCEWGLAQAWAHVDVQQAKHWAQTAIATWNTTPEREEQIEAAEQWLKKH